MPIAQSVAAVAPVVPTNEPAGASMQDAWPETGWYVPVAHRVAETAPVVPTNEPGGAVRQAELPVCTE